MARNKVHPLINQNNIDENVAPFPACVLQQSSYQVKMQKQR